MSLYIILNHWSEFIEKDLKFVVCEQFFVCTIIIVYQFKNCSKKVSLSRSGRCGKLNYMVMTHPSLSPQPGIWRNLLGLRGRVVRIMCQGGHITHSGKLGTRLTWMIIVFLIMCGVITVVVPCSIIVRSADSPSNNYTHVLLQNSYRGKHCHFS